MNIRPLVILIPMFLPAAIEDIRPILVNRVDESKKAVGIVVGTIGENGREIIGHGQAVKNQPGTPDGDTVFEIGSITKVFTSLILADMVERGELQLDTPVAKLLPETVKIPSRNGRQITLLDLSMQSSGLPRMPDNFKPSDPANPYADYTPAKMYEFLSTYSLTRDIGEKYEYSNLGAGLLGHALSRKAGMSYEQLVRKRILDPLGMSSTSITLSDSQKKRLAAGYDATLNPVKNWDLDALAGAGALRSTANDMLKFLAANLELSDTPLKPAMRRMRAIRKETGVPNLEIAMAWHILKKDGSEIVWHNGGTAGYRSFAGFDPARKQGVVVLCNTFLDVDDIGRHVLDNRYPLPKLSPSKVRTPITLSPKTLETYTGEYRLAPNFTINVTTTDGHVFLQATNQPRVEMFAENETEFFLKVVDAQVTFIKDDTGKITGLVLHQNGADVKAPKIN